MVWEKKKLIQRSESKNLSQPSQPASEQPSYLFIQLSTLKCWLKKWRNIIATPGSSTPVGAVDLMDKVNVSNSRLRVRWSKPYCLEYWRMFQCEPILFSASTCHSLVPMYLPKSWNHERRGKIQPLMNKRRTSWQECSKKISRITSVTHRVMWNRSDQKFPEPWLKENSHPIRFQERQSP